MNIYLGSDLLQAGEPYLKRIVVKSTQTVSASQLNLSNGQPVQYLLVGAGTSSLGGKVHYGTFIVANNQVDLACTIGAYQGGETTISGLGINTISSNDSFLVEGGGVFQGHGGFGAGSSSNVSATVNTGRQGSGSTGIIILNY